MPLAMRHVTTPHRLSMVAPTEGGNLSSVTLFELPKLRFEPRDPRSVVRHQRSLTAPARTLLPAGPRIAGSDNESL